MRWDCVSAFEPNGRGPKPSKAPALLPTQLKAAHNLFFQLSPSTVQTPETEQLQVALKQTLASTCSCQWVSSSSAADLIVRVSVKINPSYSDTVLNAMRLDILDPKTQVCLWSFTSGFIQNRNSATQIEKTLPYITKNWTAVIGKDHI